MQLNIVLLLIPLSGLISSLVEAQIRIPLVAFDQLRGQFVEDEDLQATKLNAGVEMILQNHDNLCWLGQIQLGSPGQVFKVLLDTGSADLWVPSVTCRTKACLSHSRFNSSSSSSFTPSSRPLRIRYGATAEVTGLVGAEQLSMAGLTVRNQMFTLADRIEGTAMDLVHFDGVLGLGFRELSQLNLSTPFENMLEQKLLSRPIFSFHLSSRPERPLEYGGELLLGEIDPSHYQGELTYVPLVRAANWQFQLDGVALAGRADIEAGGNSSTGGPQVTDIVAEVCQLGQCRAIVDTGTALISGHFEQVEQLNRHLGAYRTPTGLYKLADCGRLETLPDLVLTIAGRQFVLSPSDYIMALARSDGSISSCFSALKGHHRSEYPFWLLGNAFIRKYFTLFDYAGRRLAFAISAD